MVSVDDFVRLGFSQSEAGRLAGDRSFSEHYPDKGFDFFRARFNKIKTAYGIDDARVRKIVLSHPRFAGSNHVRVLDGIVRVYGCSRDRAVKAVLSHPQFAGLNHVRVLRQSLKLGKLAGLSKTQVLDVLFHWPILAGYSVKRKFALMGVFRGIPESRNLSADQVVEFLKKKSAASPYVRVQHGSKLVKLPVWRVQRYLQRHSLKKGAVLDKEPKIAKSVRGFLRKKGHLPK